MRNKKVGHGQGSTVESTPDKFAKYALDLAATNIVLLVGYIKLGYRKINWDLRGAKKYNGKNLE